MLRLNPHIIILTLLLFPLSELMPQHLAWEQNYGGTNWDYLSDMAQTQDGGYILLGYSTSDDQDVPGNYGDLDIWVMKIEKNGGIEWNQNYGGSAQDFAYSIIQTSDNGYIIAGNSASDDHDVSGNNGGNDYWIIKLNQAGELVWEENYGGSGDDTANEIIQTSDGGYIVAGETQSDDQDVSENNGVGDFWVIKLNNNGELQWEENYGGTERENALSIMRTPDGGYITVGWSRSGDGDVSANYGGDDSWVVKLDSSGTLDWERNYGGSMDDIFTDVQLTGEGDYLFGGSSSSSDQDVSSNFGNSDYWLVHVKIKGALDWERNYGSGDIDYSNSLIQTNDGGYLMGGYVNADGYNVADHNGSDDFWLIKVNQDGLYEWTQNLGGIGSDRLTALLQTSDGGYMAAGTSTSDDYDVSENNGSFDYWVTRLCFKSSSTVTETACNNYTLPSGRATYSASGTYKDTIPNTAGCDSIMTIDLTINQVDSSVIQSGNILQANMFDANYQWGRCEESFEPIAGATGQTFRADSSGEYAVVVMNNGCVDTSQCYSVTITGIDNRDASNGQISVYPNPAQEKVFIQLRDNMAPSSLVVYDLEGKQLFHQVLSETPTELDVSHLNPGTYIFSITGRDAKNIKHKIIIGE